jgi:hypothetical protein
LLQHIHGIEVLLFKKERVVSPSHSKDHDRWKTRTEQFSILFLFFYDSHQDLREREKMIEKTKYSSQVNRLRTPGHISAPGVPNNLQHQEFHNI